MLLAIDLIAYLLIAHIFCLGGRIAAVVVGGVVIVIVLESSVTRTGPEF